MPDKYPKEAQNPVNEPGMRTSDDQPPPKQRVPDPNESDRPESGVITREQGDFDKGHPARGKDSPAAEWAEPHKHSADLQEPRKA